MRRLPAVAYQFYPGDTKELTRELKKYAGLPATAPPKTALAVVVPHAGYMYSGGTAGATFARVLVPERALILGPNHHGIGPAAAIMASGTWEMPLGLVPIDESLAEEICRQCPSVGKDTRAHAAEHSLEVQVPFLQYFQKDLRITPITVSHLSFASCEELGHGIARAIKNAKAQILMVASTDMTHYESREAASVKDGLAMDRIKALDPEGLYQTVANKRISMCGVIPTTIALIAALDLGAKAAELVQYTDSGATTGDTRQVVGYAGFVVS